MAGKNSFARLCEAMSPESRERSERKARELREAMDLAEHRKATRLSRVRETPAEE